MSQIKEKVNKIMRKQFWYHCCKFRFVGQAVTLENCRIVKNALNAVVSLFAQSFFGFEGIVAGMGCLHYRTKAMAIGVVILGQIRLKPVATMRSQCAMPRSLCPSVPKRLVRDSQKGSDRRAGDAFACIPPSVACQTDMRERSRLGSVVTQSIAALQPLWRALPTACTFPGWASEHSLHNVQVFLIESLYASL